MEQIVNDGDDACNPRNDGRSTRPGGDYSHRENSEGFMDDTNGPDDTSAIGAVHTADTGNEEAETSASVSGDGMIDASAKLYMEWSHYNDSGAEL